MAQITFYDVSQIDRQQLEALLRDHPEHSTRYVVESISDQNINPDAEVISVFVTSSVNDALMAKMPNLKLIACRSTGFNTIDLDAAKARNIKVVNVPTYGENTVAEYAFTLILALTRKLFDTKSAVNSSRIDPSELTGMDLSGKTIGIVGMGHIGAHMAKIAKGFDMNVIAYDPKQNIELAKEVGFTYKSLDELIRSSDIVSIHVPYMPATHHLINDTLLRSAKRGQVLINTARGEIIDTKALVQALQSKTIAAAGLDVIEGEKLLNINEELLLLRRDKIPFEMLEESMEINILKTMSNVIITPHNAYNTSEAIKRINRTTVDNIIAFLDDKPTNEVKPDANVTPGKLFLIRHGESEWNALGKWTGTTDVHLTEKGFREAAMFGQKLQNEKIDFAFTSEQIRALETLEGIMDASQQFDIPFERTSAFNERDYGDYTGKNKWEMKEILGEDAFNHLRRDWDYPVPGGETLKQVFERAVPFYKDKVMPLINYGKNVLIVSHGNSMRALMKYIEKIDDKEISNLEMPFGNIIMYQVDKDGYATKKAIRTIDTTPPKA